MCRAPCVLQADRSALLSRALSANYSLRRSKRGLGFTQFHARLVPRGIEREAQAERARGLYRADAGARPRSKREVYHHVKLAENTCIFMISIGMYVWYTR